MRVFTNSTSACSFESSFERSCAEKFSWTDLNFPSKLIWVFGMSHINDLPQDVLRLLFLKHLDGRSICQSKKVCVRWRDLIGHLESSASSFWKDMMLKETNVDQAMELVGSKSDVNDWKRAYIKWNLTCSLSAEAPPLQSQFNWHSLFSAEVFAEISSIYITGSETGVTCITGHWNGYCIFWSGNECFKYLHFDTSCINHIATINFSEKESCINNLENQVMLAAGKSTIKAVSFNNVTSQHLSTVFVSSSNIVCMKIFGTSLLTLCLDSIISVMDISLNKSKNCLLNVQHRVFPPFGINSLKSPGTRWATLWNNKIICVGRELDQSEYNMVTHRWRQLKLPYWTNALSESLEICIAPKIYLFRNGIIALITYTKYLILSSNGDKYRYYVTLLDLKGNVTTVNIFGGILVLGTNTGRIYIYTFKGDDDLLNLKLENPVYSSKISTSEIYSIDVKYNNLNEIVIKAVAHRDPKIIDIRWSGFRV